MKLFNKKTNQKRVARRRLSQDVPLESRATGGSQADKFSYRRNRTLTGSLSSHVASASEHKAELRSPRIQGHDLRKHRRKIMLLLASSVLVVAVLASLVHQSIAIIKIVSAEPTQKPIDHSLYERLVTTYFSQHPFERFRFSLDEQSLARFLQNNGAPEVDAVRPHGSYAGFGASTLSLEFRKPVVAWNTGGSRTYVDTSGAAFEQNYFDKPSVEVIDKSGISTQDNQVVASSRFLGFMGKIIGRMAEQGLTIGSITLPVNTTRQVEVTLAGKAYPIKFSTDRPAGEQSEDAARAVKYLEGQKVSPKYIDVRVSGKAYYQ